jgi:hypothetical protein
MSDSETDWNAIEYKRVKRLLTDAWLEMDRMRTENDGHIRLIAELRREIRALRNLESVSQALVIARDMMEAREHEIERCRRQADAGLG